MTWILRLLTPPVLQDPHAVASEHTIEGFTTIGRHPGNRIVVLDRLVSKEHAVLEIKDEVLWIRDLGSLNGTFVNGRRIKEATLKSGDQISIGGSKITIEQPTTRLGRLLNESVIPTTKVD